VVSAAAVAATTTVTAVEMSPLGPTTISSNPGRRATPGQPRWPPPLLRHPPAGVWALLRYLGLNSLAQGRGARA
jgi:hypothetical protein